MDHAARLAPILSFVGIHFKVRLSVALSAVRRTGAQSKFYCQLLVGWMAKSNFRDGCPISTALLEVIAYQR
jgi:hypothetical protein